MRFVLHVAGVILVLSSRGCGSVTATAPDDASGAGGATGTGGQASAAGSTGAGAGGSGGQSAAGAAGTDHGGAPGGGSGGGSGGAVATAGAAGQAGPGAAGAGGVGGRAPYPGPMCTPDALAPTFTACAGRIRDPAMPNNPNAGWGCAKGCQATSTGPDLAAGGACVVYNATYCLAPVDGGDPCAACP